MAVPSPASNEPATTSAINRLSVAAGQPVCVDRDALAAVLAAVLLTSNPAEVATNCQTLPSDARLEILERHPGVFPFMRMIKVKVTAPTKLNLSAASPLRWDH